MISRRWTSGLIATVLLAAGSQPVMAGDGWYLGMDLGLAIAPGLTTQGSANDVGTKCDRFLNPALAEVTTECNTLPPLTRFSSDIDAGVGLLSGASIGRRIGAVRLEAEYVYHSTTHDDRANAQAGDGGTIAKLNQELALVEEGLDDVMAHSIFANLYYDLPTPSKWTPYLGAGIGIGLIGKGAAEGIARQPEAAGRIFNVGIILAAMIEGAALFGLVLAFLYKTL